MAPWDKKLEGLDEETRAVVDEILRSDVQPYVTQLEERANGTEMAQQLYQDLQDNPAETFVQITNELFGDDAADKVIAALDAGEDPHAALAGAVEDTPTGNLTPEQQEAINWASEQRRSTAYQTELEALKQRHAEDEDKVEIDDELFSPFVAITGGDTEAAYAGYKQFHGKFKEVVAPEVSTEGLETLTTDPPPVIGSNTAGASAATQTEQKFQSFDEAADAFMAELRPAPPALGHV